MDCLYYIIVEKLQATTYFGCYFYHFSTSVDSREER